MTVEHFPCLGKVTVLLLLLLLLLTPYRNEINGLLYTNWNKEAINMSEAAYLEYLEKQQQQQQLGSKNMVRPVFES